MSVGIILSSLCAEGTPILALGMARVWQRLGVDFKVCTFQDAPADLAGEFRDLGIEVESLSMTWNGYGKFPRLTGRVYEYCRRNRFDAILSFPFGWHSYVAWGAALAGIRRIVVHAGCYPPVGEALEMVKLRITVLIGEAWRPNIACCSNHVRTAVTKDLRVPARRLSTIYNGVNLSRFAVAQLAPLRLKGSLRLGMVARFDRDQPTLIRALKILRSKGVDVQLDLVGYGPRQGEFEQLASDLGVLQSIQFLGMRRDIPDLLHQWDVFVFAVTPYEGLGVALIEALAAGVPVIASDVGACREVLTCPTYGMLGDLFPVGDAARLADAVLQFKANPDPWWDRAKRATASVQSRFSIEAMADQYLRLLTEK
jgi:glycosyltransferase involved in cell wall biosynthesis